MSTFNRNSVQFISIAILSILFQGSLRTEAIVQEFHEFTDKKLKILGAFGSSGLDIKNTPAPSTVVCCGANEEVAGGCTNQCQVDNMSCINYGKPMVCPLYCLSGFHPCVCIEGHCRDACGRCIPLCLRNAKCTNSTVTECNEPNQVLVGCLNEEKRRTCENYFRGKNLTAEVGESCEPSICDCAAGFWMNFFGECVREHECGLYSSGVSHNPPCPQNAERVGHKSNEPLKSAGISTRYRYGVEYNSNCACKKDYLRSHCKSGRCVREEDCDRPCLCTDPCVNFQHEIYTVSNDCNMKTCRNKYIYTFAACEKTGVWRCECMNGYRRNSTNVCIPEEECEPPEFYFHQNDET